MSFLSVVRAFWSQNFRQLWAVWTFFFYFLLYFLYFRAAPYLHGFNCTKHPASHSFTHSYIHFWLNNAFQTVVRMLTIFKASAFQLYLYAYFRLFFFFTKYIHIHGVLFFYLIGFLRIFILFFLVGHALGPDQNTTTTKKNGEKKVNEENMKPKIAADRRTRRKTTKNPNRKIITNQRQTSAKAETSTEEGERVPRCDREGCIERKETGSGGEELR